MEEESANSTFYLEQKFSHVIQTRPPMPLFKENMLSCGDDRTDELSRILKKRSKSADPPMPVMFVSARREPTSPPRQSNMSYEYEHHHVDHRRS